MNVLASIIPLAAWLAYAASVPAIEKRRPSLSLLMNVQRRRWIAHAVGRQTPLDAILSSNLMSSIAFFASTTVLMILALFAVFGQIGQISEVVAQLRPDYDGSAFELEIHLLAALTLFILAFLSFTLSLRQFNHFCIMLGAIQQNDTTTDRDIDIVTYLNSVGARNFNQGIRAYYFAIPMLAWFFSPLASIVGTVFVILFLLQREFFSASRRMIEDLGTG